MILSADTILDHKAVDAMLVFTFTFLFDRFNVKVYNSLLSGYSRFPVHEPGNPFSLVSFSSKRWLGT